MQTSPRLPSGAEAEVHAIAKAGSGVGGKDVGEPIRDLLEKFAVADFVRAGSFPVVAVQKHEVQIRAEIQFATAQFSQRQNRKNSRSAIRF